MKLFIKKRRFNGRIAFSRKQNSPVNKSGYLEEFGAGNESRTRDLNLGKVALYQLSYSRATGCEYYRPLEKKASPESTFSLIATNQGFLAPIKV